MSLCLISYEGQTALFAQSTRFALVCELQSGILMFVSRQSFVIPRALFWRSTLQPRVTSHEPMLSCRHVDPVCSPNFSDDGSWTGTMKLCSDGYSGRLCSECDKAWFAIGQLPVFFSLVLASTHSLAFDRKRQVLFVSYHSDLFVFRKDGSYLFCLPIPDRIPAVSICVNDDGHLFVHDTQQNARILKFDIAF